MMNSSPPTRAMKAPPTACLQPVGDRAEKLVADGVAENVVRLLEMVEIDAENGEARAGIASASFEGAPPGCSAERWCGSRRLVSAS